MKFTSYNNNYWACDFETLTTKSSFFIEKNETKVWLAYAKKFHPFGQKQSEDEILTVTIEQFFEQFFKRKESATLFFHNLAWDGEFIKWYLVRNGFEYFDIAPKRKIKKGFTILEDNKNIYFINVFKPVRTKNGKKIVQLYIRCSLNLLTISIEKIAQIYKLPPKKNIDYHVDGWEYLDQVPKIFIEYIKTDVDIMVPPLVQFNKVFSVRRGNRITHGLAKLTISSTALNMFKAHIYSKHKNMKFKECFYLDYETVSEISKWYSGGLTTFSPNYQYKITEKINGHVYDVNSMYPSVMINNDYPVGKPAKKRIRDDYTIHLLKIFIVKAKIKNKNWPALMRPWKSISMSYPIGTRYVHYTENATAYYFDDELESLKRFYDIEYEIMDEWFFEGKKYFKDFISENYELRKKYKKEQDPREHTIKILLNSAYGKFGQKPLKPSVLYSLKTLQKGDEIKYGESTYYVDVVREKDSWLQDYKCYICYPKENPEKSINVAIAACVTKNARIRLHDAIYANIDNFLYCDTDSVFLKDDAVGIDIDDSKLGAWKCEAQFDGFELGGAKLYKLYLKNANIKSANAGINSKWAKTNLKKGDIITIDKMLDSGSKLLRKKVKGGIVLEETNYTIKKRN